MILHLNHIFELLCLLVSLVLYYKHKSSFLIVWCIYLTTLLSAELICLYFFEKGNSAFYNIINILIVSFSCYIITQIIYNKKILMLIKFLTLFYFVMLVAINIYDNSFFKTNILLFQLSFDLQLIYGLLFFYYLLITDDKTPKPTDSFGKWFATGLIIFNVGVSITFSLIDYIRNNKIYLFNLPLYRTIPKLFCVILYTCYIVALTKWKQPTTKS